MITDGYWRLELFCNMQKIRFWSLMNRVLRTSHNEHRINREILYFAVAIRKIIEDDKEARAISRQYKWKEPPLEVMRKRVPVRKFPYNSEDGFVGHTVSASDYDNQNAENIQLDLDILCNKIIHSYIWSVVYSDKRVYGVAFASDKEKTKELYLLKIEDWLKVLQFCADKATV